MSNIQTIIEEAFERRNNISPRTVETHVKEAILSVIDQLDSGQLRVAEKQNGK